MVHYTVYAMNVNIDHENNVLNSNVYNIVRSSIYYGNFWKLILRKKALIKKTFLSGSK